MRWTMGVLFPARLRMRATTGSSGARAARLLYQQRRHPMLASAASRGRSLVLSRGLGRRCDPPLEGFDELCDLLGIAPVGAAAIQSWRADRLVLCIVGHADSVVVKLGSRLDTGLSAEAAILGGLDGVAGPVLAPRVRWHGVWRDRFALATEAIQLADSQRDLSLTEAADTATALSAGSAVVGPLVHGDFSPWNLLRTPDGLALVDWEAGRMGCEPLFDLAHFVVTRGALLRREQPHLAVPQLTAPGSPGWRHLVALGVDPSTAPDLLQDYLERTWERTEASWEYRRGLLELLRARSAAGTPTPSSLAAAGAGTEPTGAAPQ
ncbi:MAG: phosphotransferase [Pseudonocardiaceae bacterium]